MQSSIVSHVNNIKIHRILHRILIQFFFKDRNYGTLNLRGYTFEQFIMIVNERNRSHPIRNPITDFRYHYKGDDGEIVPKTVTHVTIDSSVTTIKQYAFDGCILLFCVVMTDNVKKLERAAFGSCRRLKFIRLSKVLEIIEPYAFEACTDLEFIFLPETVQFVKDFAFGDCRQMRLLQLPLNMNPNNLGDGIIHTTKLVTHAETQNTYYEDRRSLQEEMNDNDEEEEGEGEGEEEEEVRSDIEEDEEEDHTEYTPTSNHNVNSWLINHMSEFPLHRICYSSSVSKQTIELYLNTHGKNSVHTKDTISGMTPLHILSLNPYATNKEIKFLLDIDHETAFHKDINNNSPIDYATQFNFSALVTMMELLSHNRENYTAKPY